MREADPGSLQAGWIKAGLLQRVLSEAPACKGTEKILNRFDYQLLLNQSVLTKLHFWHWQNRLCGAASCPADFSPLAAFAAL